jgi:hypothetical protein
LTVAGATLLVGVALGYLAYFYFVAAPGRDALLVGLRDEMSVYEEHAVRSFAETNGSSSILAQRHFILFMTTRQSRGWVSKSDARRAIGMAKLRIAVEHENAGNKKDAVAALDEANSDLRSAGMTYDIKGLLEATRRLKKVVQ